MKLKNGTDITNYNLPQLAKLRDEMIIEYQHKRQATQDKQSKLAELQREVIEMQNDVIALGNDIIAVDNQLEEIVKTAHPNN